MDGPLQAAYDFAEDLFLSVLSFCKVSLLLGSFLF